MLKRILAPLVLLCAAAPALAQRFDAEAVCAATDIALAYDCVIRLSAGGAPVEGAVLEVKADMPEMPMAHNVRPVPAEAAEEPGSYRVPLQLEMDGRWTLRLEITAPRRDVVILHQDFPPKEAAEDAGGHKHGQ